MDDKLIGGWGELQRHEQDIELEVPLGLDHIVYEKHHNQSFLNEVQRLVSTLTVAAEKRGIPKEMFGAYLKVCAK